VVNGCVRDTCTGSTWRTIQVNEEIVTEIEKEGMIVDLFKFDCEMLLARMLGKVCVSVETGCLCHLSVRMETGNE